MGQDEVYVWLKNQYEKGLIQFFTVQEIEKGLQAIGYSNGTIKDVRVDCIKLTNFKFLESKDLDITGWNNYKRVFRFKNG